MNWQKEMEARKKAAKTLIKDFLKQRKESGDLTQIKLSYSGYGDSSNDFELDKGDCPQNIEDAIWDILPEGFENNEGGQGTVILDPASGKIIVNHEDNYISVEKSRFTY